MARDYVKEINELIAADNQRGALRVASAFQTKIIKSIENTLGSPDGAEQTRIKLATYTASHAAYGDLAKMLCVLRARDALAKFNEALPAMIKKFDDARVLKITALLDGLAKDHPDAVPFALALVASRLRTSWQLIRLATKAAPSKQATDIAATPYALAVSMVLDRLEDKRSALRVALRNDRVLDCRNLLRDIYDTEYALQVRIDSLEESDWGKRLRDLMNAIAVLVDAEVSRFPPKVGHVLGSRRLRSVPISEICLTAPTRTSVLGFRRSSSSRGRAADPPLPISRTSMCKVAAFVLPASRPWVSRYLSIRSLTVASLGIGAKPPAAMWFA